MFMSFVAIKKANNPDELQPVKKWLESEGIECRVVNEKPDQVINVVPTPLVELQVKKEDYGKACSVLNKTDEE
jgi:hypothetical protein